MARETRAALEARAKRLEEERDRLQEVLEEKLQDLRKLGNAFLKLQGTLKPRPTCLVQALDDVMAAHGSLLCMLPLVAGYLDDAHVWGAAAAARTQGWSVIERAVELFGAASIDERRQAVEDWRTTHRSDS